MRLLTIADDHSLTQSTITIPLARRLLRFKGSADTVQLAIQELSVSDDELDPWIEVTLTEGDISPLINDQIRSAAAAKSAVVLKVGRQLKDVQLGNLPSESSKAISEWKPFAVFEKRIEGYDGDLAADALKQYFNHVLNAVQEEDAR